MIPFTIVVSSVLAVLCTIYLWDLYESDERESGNQDE